MPTWARPATICFWEGPWPCTSAEGLSTRSSSAGKRKRDPSSKSISSDFSAVFRRISTGQCGAPMPGLIPALARLDLAGLVDQHDGDAVADGVGEPGLAADQLLRRRVIFQRALGQRADQDLQQLGIDLVRLRHDRAP